MAPPSGEQVQRPENSHAMAHVTLIGNLRQFTGGVSEIEIEAGNVHQLFTRLGERYPALLPHLQTGSAVAIDGQIYQDALFQEIGPESDVHILPQIAGG
jgi:sulfur-carrier protein